MSTPEQQLAQSRELAREQQYRLSELADNVAALRGALRETDAVNEKLLAENARLHDEIAHLHEGMTVLRAELKAAGKVLTSLSDKLGDAEATIERVRVAARKAKDSANRYDMEDVIDAALHA